MDGGPALDPDLLVDALAREGRALRDAASTRLDADVVTCPGWVVADVVGHLGRVYRSVTQILEERLQDPPMTAVPRPPAGEAVLDFFTEGLDALVAALAATPVDTPLYTWASDRTAGFYRRRMCHETAAHRLDVAPDAPLDADVAADGVSELYDVVLPFGLARHRGPRPAGSLHLHRTDGPGEWTLELDGDQLRVGRVHGKATAAVRGGGSDLFRFVWHRGRGASIEVFGDEQVADAWAGLAP